MVRSMWFAVPFTAAALAALPAVAHAGKGKPLAGSEHTPPVFLDEASAFVRVVNRSSDGYVFQAHVEVKGISSKTDLLRLDWKQKGKVIATAKCDAGMDVDSNYASGSCDYDGTPVKAKGPIEAELIYWDDQAEKEYLVRTFKVTVANWPKEIDGGQEWQIIPDDVLAAAWIWHGGDSEDDRMHSGVYKRPILYLWVASGAPMVDLSARCTVDGTTKIADFDVGGESGSDTGEIDADHLPPKGQRITYHWQKVKLNMDIYWGPKDKLEGMDGTKERGLADNPGKWDCQLRREGKTVRELLFTVDKDGMIQQDEMQSGKGAIPTLSSEVLIDIRIPKDNGLDERVRPDAMKKSMGFGLPWPDSPKVKTIQAAFPPKSGLVDPPK